MRLGYLGPEGTFSEDAVRTAADAEGARLVPLATVRDTVLAVADGSVDRAVVPIENSLEGPVGVTLDTLADGAGDVAIVGEVVLAVSQCLIARRALSEGEVERVLSHPQALAQCAGFVRARLPAAAVVPVSSTAEAVRLVAEADGAWAALGTRRSAALYGCEVLAEGVEDEPGNATRFVWLARGGASAGAPGETKTSLTFWGTGDEAPGWLVRCLSEFAFRGVNLTKIESRPLRGRLGHYRFFLDCGGAAAESPVSDAIEGLRAHCDEVRVLGSYRAAG